ncbi:MAG TPA: dienelactone hydrolase family protein [Candidatus Binataceae bacterium]
MRGQWIEIKTPAGEKFRGYLSVPESGSGPGLVVLQEIFGVNQHIREVTDQYAEEGYIALAPEIFWRVEPGVELGYTADSIPKGRALAMKLNMDVTIKDIDATIATLRAMAACSGKVAAVGYCFGGLLAFLTAARTDVDAAISYYGGGIDARADEAKSIKCPVMLHYGEKDHAIPAQARETARKALASHPDAEIYLYREAEHGFNCSKRASYHPFSAQLARSRTIGLLRRTIGPRFDLSALWDHHCDGEFTHRDVDETMQTMVAQPYVNHIPTLTGGYGYAELYRFYKNHFIPRLPKDTKVVPLSRTVGSDRVVDEIMFCFTHDMEIDFMLPGIQPTGKYVEIPVVAIIEFRGDKLYNEHIYWDQGSLLAQVGLLDTKKLPVAGIETAKKLKGEDIPSNQMMPTWRNSASK